MSDDFIPYEAIPARIAEVRQSEADYPEFCKPAIEFTPEQHATARAYAAALMSDYSPGMTDWEPEWSTFGPSIKPRRPSPPDGKPGSPQRTFAAVASD